jgi:hypothetical protein
MTFDMASPPEIAFLEQLVGPMQVFDMIAIAPGITRLESGGHIATRPYTVRLF